MYLTNGKYFKPHNKMQYNYSTRSFNRRAKLIRIIADPDNQRPDKWSSTVLNLLHFIPYYFTRKLSTGSLCDKPFICL